MKQGDQASPAISDVGEFVLAVLFRDGLAARRAASRFDDNQVHAFPRYAIPAVREYRRQGLIALAGGGWHS